MTEAPLTVAEHLAILRSPERCPAVVKLSNLKLNDDQAQQIADILTINKIITSLSLDGNQIRDKGAKALGDALKSNTSMQYLNISGNQITFDGARHIFAGIKVNRSLRVLEFASNNLASDDPNQKELFVAFQFNKTITSVNLSNDKLGNQSLIGIFEGIFHNKEPCIKHLDISSNNFGDVVSDYLKKAMSANSSLKILTLSYNPLGSGATSALAEALKTNVGLADLRLCQLPASASSGLATLLQQLETSNTVNSLDLSFNGVPSNIGDFLTKNTSVTKLNLHHNLIRNNELGTIAKALEVNTTLKQLTLSDNLARQDGIAVFAQSLKINTGLEYLDFSLNFIGEAAKQFAEGIMKNRSLKVLHLNGAKELNKIGKKQLIHMLAANPPLVLLSMNDVGMAEEEAKELPKAIKANTRLEELFIKGNLFAADLKHNGPLVEQLIGIFNVSTNLIKLEMDIADIRLWSKNLEGRSLTEFPPSIVRMTHLQTLNLANNFIERIPDGISMLTDLTDLNLSSNRLLTLPPSMGFLTNLKNLRIAQNSFQTPPPEVTSKNVKIILGYLRDLAKGAEALYRVKLMMVGQENVGKTTLLKMIKRRRVKKASKKTVIKTISTDGIDIEEWQIEVNLDDDVNQSGAQVSGAANLNVPANTPAVGAPTPNQTAAAAKLRTQSVATGGRASQGAADMDEGKTKRFVTVSAWDFAGQEIYYTTHQFFLSERSIYILVWDLRYEDEESKVSYWLQSIRSRTKGAPVIIVGTHLDDFKDPEVAQAKIKAVQKKYKKRFPFICGVMAVSCKPDSDITPVMNRIREVIASQDHMGENIPRTYMELERLIKQEKILVKEGKARFPPIRRWDEIKQMASYCHINDEDELRRCIGLLHDMGSLIYFDDPSLGVRDLVIIDSQFLTSVMSTIITTKTVIRDGILDHRLLPMIWRAPDFPPEIHEVLLGLLEKFEIAYTLPATLRNRLRSHAPRTSVQNLVPISVAAGLPPPGRPKSLMLPLKPTMVPPAEAMVSTAPPAVSSTENAPVEAAAVGPPQYLPPPVSTPPQPSTYLAPPVSTPPLPPTAGTTGSYLAPPVSTPPLPPVGGVSSQPPSPEPPTRQPHGVPVRALPPVPGQAPAAPGVEPVVGGATGRPVAPSFAPRPLPNLPTLPQRQFTAHGTPAHAPPSGPPPPTHLPALPPSIPAPLANTSSTESSSSNSNSGTSTPTGTNSLDRALPPAPAANLTIAVANIAPPAVTTPATPTGISPAALAAALQSQQSESETLIPALLPEDRPDFELLWRAIDTSKVQYDRRYQLEFVPKGFFSRLMIRLLHHVDDVSVYWRNGIIASRDKDLFLVEMKPGEASLVLTVRGQRRSPPTETLRMCVETIEVLIGLNNWFNIKVDKFVPCAHCLEAGFAEAKIWQFPLEELVDLAARGIWVAECQSNAQDIKSVQLNRLVPDLALADLENAKIPYDQLQLLDEVGKGAFGVIYRAIWQNQVVAVKSLTGSNQEDTKQKAFEEFRREVWVMSGMRHPNLVNLLGFCVNPFAIVMEFVEHGNLYNFLRKRETELSWSLRLKIALDVARGLFYLHDATPPFIHRDLKSPNILIISPDPTSEVCAKVGDFGLSSRLYVPALKQKSIDREVANPTWLAPEIIREEEYTEKSDIYSYGIILWELLTQQHPYQEFNFQFMFELEDIVKKGHRPTMPEDAPASYASLIRRCWTNNPEERPSFLEILKSIIAIAAELAPTLHIPENVLARTSPSIISHETSAEEDGETLGGAVFLKHIKPTHSAASQSAALAAAAASGNSASGTLPPIKIYSLLFVPPNLVWAGCRFGSILVFNSENGMMIARHEGVHKTVTTMLLVGNRVWTHCWGEEIKIWKTMAPDQLQNAVTELETGATKEGYLQHRAGGLTRKVKRRWIVVKNKQLMMYKLDTDKAPVLNLDLTTSQLVAENNPKKLGFLVKPRGGKPLEIICLSKAEQQEWVTAITAEVERQQKSYDLDLVSRLEANDAHCVCLIDGKVWAGTTEMRLKVWDSETFQLIRNHVVDAQMIQGVDAKTLFISNIVDYDNRMWLSVQKFVLCLDKESMMPLRVMTNHSMTINSLLGFDNRIWTCSDDSTIRVWDAQSYEPLHAFSDLSGKQFAMIRFGSQIWCAGFDATIRVFNGKTCQLIKVLEVRHTDAIASFALSLGTVWAGSWDGTISIYGAGSK